MAAEPLPTPHAPCTQMDTVGYRSRERTTDVMADAPLLVTNGGSMVMGAIRSSQAVVKDVVVALSLGRWTASKTIS